MTENRIDVFRNPVRIKESSRRITVNQLIGGIVVIQLDTVIAHTIQFAHFVEHQSVQGYWNQVRCPTF